MLNIYSAPLQGYTEAPWRKLHNDIFGGIKKYYAPFMRIEHRDFRKKDLRDLSLDNNVSIPLVPQILTSEPEQACKMITKLLELNYKEIDINLGCPFPPIAKHHLGCGLLPYKEKVETLLNSIKQYKGESKFSIKTRLGYENNRDLLELLPIIEDFSPSHITIHPRIGTQQYKGEVDLNADRKSVV